MKPLGGVLLAVGWFGVLAALLYYATGRAPKPPRELGHLCIVALDEGRVVGTARPDGHGAYRCEPAFTEPYPELRGYR